MVQSKPLARRAFIGFSCTRFRALPRSRPAAFLVCTSALARGGCHIMLRGGLGNSARVTDAVYWVVTIWFLHYATKAVKPATAPSTTSMAVTMGGSGVWPGIVHCSPAAQDIVRLYCSSGKDVFWGNGTYWCVLLGRRVFVQMWRPRPPS